MATVTRKVKGGKWYAIYIDNYGRQKWKAGYTDKVETQRLADRLENEARAIRLGDVDPQQESRRIERAKSIKDHLAQYENSLKAAGRDKNHVSYTIRDIELFIGFSAATHSAAIGKPQVDSWVLAMRDEGIDANRTINRRVGSLQAFLKWLHGQGVISDYVLLKFPKLKTTGSDQKRKRRALTADESKLLLGSKTPRLDLYTFALFSGARYSAVVALKVADVDMKSETMALRRKARGGGKSTYHVPIHPKVMPILERLVAGKKADDSVFPAMRREDAAKLVREDCSAAKIDTTDVDFHALRHTFITQLAKANVHPKITQELAGHSSIEMTLNYYTHFQRADKMQALKLLN